MRLHTLVSAILLVTLTGCAIGGQSQEQSAPTTGAQNSTSTTLDTSTLSIRQNIKPLEPSSFNIAPVIVSTQNTPGQAQSGASSGQVSPSDVQRQEQLLSELEAKRNADGIVVSLPEVVLFDFGKADVRPDAAASLDKVTELLKFYPRINLSIEGHTDNVGSDASNQTLSQRRADAVRAALVTRGVPADRLTTTGFGESRPAVPNDSDANRQKNRRVEIVFQGA